VEGRGLGLQTVRQRLELLYGDAARFEVHTRPRGGFRVTIAIPAEEPDPEWEPRAPGAEALQR
jgi:two-component system LytT family sensor kinase